MTKSEDPIILYTSGGNTQIISFIEKKYRILGEVLDQPIGNVLDSFARFCELPQPGGPIIEKLAKNGKWTSLPYSVKGMDMSFTGILTEAKKKFKSGEKLENICYSLQETCFAMLTEVVERAIAHTKKNEVLLVGGVASNQRLTEMLNIMCEDRKSNFFVVPKEFCGDNGINIAWTCMLMYKSQKPIDISKSKIIQNFRVEDVDVSWL